MDYTIGSRRLVVKVFVPPSKGSSKEGPYVADVRWHPCKVISCSEIDAVGKRPPPFGLAESMSNGVIGVALWWSVSSLGVGKSRMGSSSRDDDEKKMENPVFPNLVRSGSGD